MDIGIINTKPKKKVPPSQATWQHGQQGDLGYSVGHSVEKQVPVFVTETNSITYETTPNHVCPHEHVQCITYVSVTETNIIAYKIPKKNGKI